MSFFNPMNNNNNQQRPTGFNFTGFSSNAHISFVRSTQSNNNNSRPAFSFSFSSSRKGQTISLVNNKGFDVFEYISRTFAISTKNGSSFFNTFFLQDTSSVISQFIKENPQHKEYHLDIQDDDNILGKFEQMYQGEYVEFNEDELSVSQKITKLLNITQCPNFLKPESLKGPEQSSFTTSFGKTKTNMFGVQIDKYKLNSYFSNACPKTFKIKTNKKEYMCCIFGVYSSAVIRKILADDPNVTEYVYDFDDEFDEFEEIATLFNFRSAEITKNNIDSIKMIAEDLQIDCVLGDIDNFINTTEKVSKSIDEQQTITDSIDEVFQLLYKIKEKTVEKVKTAILESKWSQTEDNVKEFAAFIFQVIRTSIPLQKYIIDLLEELNKEADSETNKLEILIPFIINKMRSFLFQKNGPSSFSSNTCKMDMIIKNSNGSFAFYYNLYKRGFISKEELQNDLSNLRGVPVFMKLWFLPEMILISPSSSSVPKMGMSGFTTSNSNQVETFIRSITYDKIEDYKKMRDAGEPLDELTRALRNDDVDTLQTILSKTTTDKSKCFVPFNMFETFVENGRTNYINYAAAYGSVKCFKYILLNHDSINRSTFSYAVNGGNIEIIKIVEQREKEDLNQPKPRSAFSFSFGASSSSNSKLDEINPAIFLHQNDLFDYIFEQRLSNLNKEQLNNLISNSIENGNAHSLTQIIDKGFNLNDFNNRDIIQVAASVGFYSIAQLICNITDQSKVFRKSLNIHDCFTFDNISILKLFLNRMNQNDLDSTLKHAINLNWTSTQKYFLETLIKDNYKLTPDFAFILLNDSLNKPTNDTFDYIIERIKSFNPTFFTNNIKINDSLSKACKNRNIEAVKTLTQIKIDNEIKDDYTSFFLSAASSDASDICKYFVDMNVPINYEKLSSQVSELGSISDELFSIILSKVSPEAKERILGCLDQAIEKNNKSLVKYLLKENSFVDNALFLAIKTNDVELVDIILNYNSQPSFINKISQNGTALTVAVYHNNLQIVKKLLSLPGINPSLYYEQNMTPLIRSVYNLNLEIMNAILDFYGEDIHNQKWQIDRAIKFILDENTQDNRIPKEKREENDNIKGQILSRILELKDIDLNYHFDINTFLTYACSKNNIDLVQTLLKSEEIDVNLYEPKRGNTPLIIAVNNDNLEIAKLLIEYPKTDINWRNYAEQTALTSAVHNNNNEIIDLIIKSDKFKPEESRANFAFLLSKGEASKQLISVKSLDVNYEAEITNMRSDSDGPRTISSFGTFRPPDAPPPTTTGFGTATTGFGTNRPPNAQPTGFGTTTTGFGTGFGTNRPPNAPSTGFGTSIATFSSNRNKRNKNVETSLTCATKTADIEKIDLIINHPSFDKVKSQLKSAILISVMQKKLEIFKKLLKLIDDDVNICDFDGKSLLFYSAVNNCYDIFKEIINNPNFDSRKSDILTCFILLFTPNIDRRRPGNQNMGINQISPVELMNEIFNYDKEHEHLINLTNLLPSGKSFFTVTKSDTPYDEKIYDFLLENGADPNLPDQFGVYPLQYALNVNSIGFVRSLIDSEKVDYSKEILKEIKRIKKEDNRNTISNEKIKTTYIHLAAESGNEEIIRLFLERRVMDINATDELGDTPLIYAARSRRCKNIEILFESDDLDYRKKNNSGLDALASASIGKSVSESPEDKNEYMNVLIQQVKRSGNNSGFTFQRNNQNENNNKEDENKKDNEPKTSTSTSTSNQDDNKESKKESESPSESKSSVPNSETKSEETKEADKTAQTASSQFSGFKLGSTLPSRIQNKPQDAAAESSAPKPFGGATFTFKTQNKPQDADAAASPASAPIGTGATFGSAGGAKFSFGALSKPQDATSTSSAPKPFGGAAFTFKGKDTAAATSPASASTGAGGAKFSFGALNKPQDATATPSAPKPFGGATFTFKTQDKPQDADAAASPASAPIGAGATFGSAGGAKFSFGALSKPQDATSTPSAPKPFGGAAFTFKTQNKPQDADAGGSTASATTGAGATFGSAGGAKLTLGAPLALGTQNKSQNASPQPEPASASPTALAPPRKLEFHSESFSEEPSPSFMRPQQAPVQNKAEEDDVDEDEDDEGVEQNAPLLPPAQPFYPQYSAFDQNALLMQQQQWMQMVQMNNERMYQMSMMNYQNQLLERLQKQPKKKRKSSKK